MESGKTKVKAEKNTCQKRNFATKYKEHNWRSRGSCKANKEEKGTGETKQSKNRVSSCKQTRLQCPYECPHFVISQV